jgi:hypothetical protein
MGLHTDPGGQISVSTIAFPSSMGAVPGFDATAEFGVFTTTATPVAFK